MEDEDNPTMDERMRLQLEQTAGQGLVESAFTDQTSETVAYVNAFGEDEEFISDTTGRISQGNIPHGQKRKLWGVNNKNLVFSKIDKDQRQRIDDMEFSLNCALTTYHINPKFFMRKRAKILQQFDEGKIKTLEEKEAWLNLINKKEYEAYNRVNRITDVFNQNIHTFAKVNRASPGEPGAERKALFTKAVISDRPERGGDKNPGGGWWRR
jgi:hypothetical protein